MKASATTTVRIVRKGKDGIGITVSPQSVVFRQGEMQQVKVYVDFYVGGTKIAYGSGDGQFLCSTLASSSVVLTGLFWSFGTESDGRFYYILTHGAGAIANVELPFNVIYGGKQYPASIQVSTVADAERGAARRGPANWKDFPADYQFESGAKGETFFDVVYNVISGERHYYVCKTSHAKAAAKEPGVSTGWDTYWASTSEIPFLEAKYALMDWIDANTIALKKLTLINAAIPTVGEIRGVPTSIAITATSATGANGSGASNVGSASSPQTLSVSKTVTITGGRWGRCFFDIALKNTAPSSKHALNITDVKVWVNGTAVTEARDGAGYGFEVNANLTSFKIDVTFKYWLRYVGNVSGGESQLSQYKIEASIGGVKDGNGALSGYMRFFPKVAPAARDPRTVIGTNGFLTTDDDAMLFHVQHDDRTVSGVTYPKAVTMLVGDYGLRITTQGISQTFNGGLGWLAGIIEDKAN